MLFSDSDELVVPTSRTKLAAVAVGAIAFVVLGGWLLLRDLSTIVIRLVGALSVGFYEGICSAFYVLCSEFSSSA